MSSSGNKYLDRLKAKFPETRLSGEPSKPSKPSFEGFEGSPTRPISDFSPPLDPEGVPCGGCPKCNQGEFWRWPKFHKDHNPRGWICWFCSPPPEGSGPCDFCGVPDQMLEFGGNAA
jgi:hypothetical protein